MKQMIAAGLLLIFLSSCSHVISRENLDASLTNVAFMDLQAHHDRYEGKQFIFGGIIAETINSREGAEIEVVQTPLDRWGYVISRDASDGRFIVSVTRQLDPLIFRPGREVVVSGILSGSRTKQLGGMDYTYPVFTAREVRLVSEDRYYASPYWTDPFYPYYPYSPYLWFGPRWYRPYFAPY